MQKRNMIFLALAATVWPASDTAAASGPEADKLGVKFEAEAKHR